MIEKWDLAAVYMLKYASGLECEIVMTFLAWFVGVLLKVNFPDYNGVFLVLLWTNNVEVDAGNCGY